ncbi:MAG: hypothetical protein ACI9MR_002649 [Myxococcota bacterium]|jgi:hypothetical protein
MRPSSPTARTLAVITTLMLAGAPTAMSQPVDPDQADANFDAIMGPQSELQEPSTVVPVQPWVESDAVGSEIAAVTVSLEAFENLWRTNVDKATAQTTARLGPAVVLGATRYAGEARDGALHLDVSVSLTLSRPDAWKTVPLVGDGAVLVKAEVDGAPIGVAKSNGFHVWLTQRTGEVVVQLKIIVPAHGPRGSIEYDFVGPRTPVTEFAVRFPGADLEPRIDDAVQSEVKSADGVTTLNATLRPTTRIHVVGFRDLGTDSDARARVYAETRSLLSIDDGVVEVFSEAQYTILYAGTKRFDILVPKGVTVVSADGKGAFRYELETREDGTLIRGETAFPIRNSYAVSLRLRTETGKSGAEFAVPLPRLLGVERDVGWLAVEVPGKLMLEESKRPERFVAVDVRGLPSDLVRSAVSPILMAYRVRARTAASDGAAAPEPLLLSASRLPEKDIASEQIDRIRAFTVVSAEGTTLTELRLTLRNRLRQSLAATLPEGAEVRSVILDGAPVKPSIDDAGRLLLPLKRSEGEGGALRPVTLQLVYEMPIDALGWFGRRDLTLPTLELPASSVEWSLFLPSAKVYDEPIADIAPQSYWTEGSWIAPRSEGGADESRINDELLAGDLVVNGSDGDGGQVIGNAGAMPVRITLPQSGHRLSYERYWLSAEQSVTVGIRFAERWLSTPLLLLLMAGLAAIVILATRRRQPISLPLRVAYGVGGGAFAAGLLYFFGVGPVLLAVLGGGLVAMTLRGSLKRAVSKVGNWARALPEGYRKRLVSVERPPIGPRVLRGLLVVATVLVAVVVLDRALSVLGIVL